MYFSVPSLLAICRNRKAADALPAAAEQQQLQLRAAAAREAQREERLQADGLRRASELLHSRRLLATDRNRPRQPGAARLSQPLHLRDQS